MKLLILGRGKTGSLVAEVAAERKHHIQIVGAKENAAGAALTPEKKSEKKRRKRAEKKGKTENKKKK